MKLNKIISVALGMAVLPMLSGCDSDDPVTQTPLNSPVVTTSSTTFKTIDCSWDRVDGATNYGYELTDADGNVVIRSVTTLPTVSLTDLNYSTVYYLNVWAYGAYGSADGTSEASTYEFRTDDLVPLETPVVTAKKGSGTRVQFSWTGNSTLTDHYEYTLYRPDGTIQTNNTRPGTNPSVTITLNSAYQGEYTFTVRAYVKEDYTYPKGQYCDSEIGTTTYQYGSSNSGSTPVAP